MRYNEKNSIQVGERNIIDRILDDNTIIEVSAQVLSNIYGKLQANYDLIVYGDINVESLTVMGNLVCFGNCKAIHMNVQGRCDIFGTLEVEDALLSDDLRVRELIVEEIEIKGKTICDSIDNHGKLIGHNRILVSDGIMGEGEIESNLVMCGEYSFVEDDKHVFVAGEIEEQLNSSNNIQLELDLDVSNMEIDECEEYLESLSCIVGYEKEYAAYIELKKWQNVKKINSINEYVELAEILNRKGDKYRNSKLYYNVKTMLFDNYSERYEEIELISLSQKEFARINYLLYDNCEMFLYEAFDYIRKALYGKIGLKYNSVEMMLGG